MTSQLALLVLAAPPRPLPRRLRPVPPASRGPRPLTTRGRVVVGASSGSLLVIRESHYTGLASLKSWKEGLSPSLGHSRGPFYLSLLLVLQPGMAERRRLTGPSIADVGAHVRGCFSKSLELVSFDRKSSLSGKIL